MYDINSDIHFRSPPTIRNIHFPDTEFMNMRLSRTRNHLISTWNTYFRLFLSLLVWAASYLGKSNLILGVIGTGSEDWNGGLRDLDEFRVSTHTHIHEFGVSGSTCCS